MTNCTIQLNTLIAKASLDAKFSLAVYCILNKVMTFIKKALGTKVGISSKRYLKSLLGIPPPDTFKIKLNKSLLYS